MHTLTIPLVWSSVVAVVLVAIGLLLLVKLLSIIVRFIPFF